MVRMLQKSYCILRLVEDAALGVPAGHTSRYCWVYVMPGIDPEPFPCQACACVVPLLAWHPGALADDGFPCRLSAELDSLNSGVSSGEEICSSRAHPLGYFLSPSLAPITSSIFSHPHPSPPLAFLPTHCLVGAVRLVLTS